MARVGLYLLVAVAFGALIFVHELGHFLAAKWTGVRVEVFSLGFGPFLLSWTRGETTYAVSMIPFGGYVKMTGQAEVGKKGRPLPPYDWNAKSPLQRALVLVCGVAMNIGFAYVLFVVVYLVGLRVTPAKVGLLDPDGRAYEAGLRTGDVFLEIDGRRTFRYDNIIALLSMGEGTRSAVIRRGERILELALPSLADPQTTPGIYPPPVVERPLRIGCTGKRRILVVGVVEGSPAEKAGVRSGDIIAAVESNEVSDVPDVRRGIASKGGAEVGFEIVRAGEKLNLRARPIPNEGRYPSAGPWLLGVDLTTRTCVDEVQRGSPAERAGLEPFDIIELENLEMEGNEATLSWRRGLESLGPETLEISPDYLAFPVLEREQNLERRGLIWKDGRAGALLMGFSECWHTVRNTLSVFWAILTAKMEPSKGLGGPISIAFHVYRAAKAGADYYVWLVGAFSAMIGVFNLFPIPPLDGGLLLFEAMEKLRGRPAERKTRELVQTVGVVLFLILIVYVIFLDIGRIPTWLGR